MTDYCHILSNVSLTFSVQTYNKNKMRRVLFFITSLIMLTSGMSLHAQVSSSQDDVAAEVEDSTVDVIGWFCKNDTVDYWISEGKWKVNDGDTIKTAGVNTKVRLVVTDSTAAGYKMNYTFLECEGDTTAHSRMGDFQNKIVELLGKKIVGTTIKFETDETGKITRFTNLAQIKKQAKSLFKDCMKELMKMKEMAALKEIGLDIKKLIEKNSDTDELVDGYTEELQLLLMCHGKSWAIGEKTIHEDATEEEYESDTQITASVNSEDDSYSLSVNSVSIIPQEVVKGKLKELLGMFTEEKEFGKSIDEAFEAENDYSGSTNTYYEVNCFSNGWPYKVVEQKANMIGKRGKLEQTYIVVDAYSFCNY